MQDSVGLPPFLPHKETFGITVIPAKAGMTADGPGADWRSCTSLPGGASIAPPNTLCYNLSPGYHRRSQGYHRRSPGDDGDRHRGITGPLPGDDRTVTGTGARMTSSPRKKIYTKYGDEGSTSLLYGGRVSKNNVHTEAYGITGRSGLRDGSGPGPLRRPPRSRRCWCASSGSCSSWAAELATDPERYEVFNRHFKPVTAAMVAGLEDLIDALWRRRPRCPTSSSSRAAPRPRRPWTWPAPSREQQSAAVWPSKSRVD